MVAKNTELPELFKKVIAGITEANRKLVEETAAAGRSLVVSVNGEIKNVPAKELLEKLTTQK